MNFLQSCLGSLYSASAGAGDSSKGAKPVRITGPARPLSAGPYFARPPYFTRDITPPRSRAVSIFGSTTEDPSKGAKPVRITGPARPARTSPYRNTSPHRKSSRPASSQKARRHHYSPGGLSPVASSGGISQSERTGDILGGNTSLVSSPNGRRSPRNRSPSPSPRRGSPPRKGSHFFLSRPPSPTRDSPRISPKKERPVPLTNSPKGSPKGNSRGEMMRRPSEVDGRRMSSNDPYACTHLTELMPITPMESSYRVHDGASLPEGIEAPESSDQNMRRLYTHDEDRVLLKVVHYGNPTSVGIEFEPNGEWQFKPLWAQRAGPRSLMYFNPANVKAAIVTCGGLCPGLNDVIRQVVFTLDLYGVKEILGIQYGFKGFVDPKYPPVTLTRKSVERLHMAGGSFLGVSRGTPDLNIIVDKLQDWNVTFFFVIGGNGSHAGAHAIYLKCLDRKLKIAIIGIPKTIDNDLQLMDKTFGFDTSVEEAQRAINAGFVEASSAYNGVAIIKLMGRQSGFIAMYATLASGQVDIVLIPEVPFVLEGDNGVYEYMKRKLEKNGLCVVVVAEGAGQDLLETSGGVDASGNPILGDIGKWLLGQVKTHFGRIKVSVDVKYIDPTYMIRARPCNSSDHILCSVLGQNAVHGAFAGYTDMTIGLVNTHYVFLPIPKVIEVARMVDPNSNMWHRTVTATGQPHFPSRNTPKVLEKAPSNRRQSKTGTSRSPSPGGDSVKTIIPTEPRQRLSQISIKIDKNNVQIRSVDNYIQKRTQ